MVIYREEQWIRKSRWMWLMYAVFGLVVAIVIVSIVQQLILDEPVGTVQVSDEILILINSHLLFWIGGLTWLLYQARLITEVRPDGIAMQFRPFHRTPRMYDWNAIRDMETRTYKPIREYGGWGIRLSIFGRGTAYNVTGNQGLQLQLMNGRRLLIGTQQPEELEAAIQEATTKKD